MKKESTSDVMYEWNPGDPISEESMRQLKALAAMPDSEINYTDAPPLSAGGWKISGRTHADLFKPRKETITIRVDADVLAWLRQDGEGYQSRLNAILRSRMTAEQASPRP